MEDSNWYFKINDYLRTLSDYYNVPLVKVAGIMSALSPNNTFRHNIISTEKFLRTRGDCKVTCFNSQKEKAIRILNADNNVSIEQVKGILGKGLKTRAFFCNMVQPDNSKAVTVDLWMIRYAKKHKLMPTEGGLTVKRYKTIETHVQSRANELGIMPHQLQAKIWCEIRGEAF